MNMTLQKVPWTGDRLIARSVLLKDSTTQTVTYIHASSGIRTEHPSFLGIYGHTHKLTCEQLKYK